MTGQKKKKYTSGEAAQFITRAAALKKLQLTLTDFRKLCILKGIYPREPRNRRRAQKGDPTIKTLYHKKDIQFLMHEAQIWRLRDIKVIQKRIGRAKALKDYRQMRRLIESRPTLRLDHIVKERYPTFTDALRDLDDCLTLCFLFSTFPSMKHLPRDQFEMCQRLTTEFMHAIIQAKALRKVFISIKGYYFQAELMGQTITWIVPHHFSFEPQSKSEVDFKIMSTFVEFYTILLGFVNFRLYHNLNFFYPPKLSTSTINDFEKTLVDEEALVSERIAALNVPLVKITNVEEEETQIDHFPSTSSEDTDAQLQEAAKIISLKSLFNGLKFFLNREVPREPLVFIIRCFGGEVSWDKSLFVGSTFDENDESITHQIIDRPIVGSSYLSRHYVQPQWLFDCVNARELLPVNKYFVGEPLPPHASPFEELKEHDDVQIGVEDEKEATEDNEEEVEEEEVEEDETEKDANPKVPTLQVSVGKVETENVLNKIREERRGKKLQEKMVPNKHKRMFSKMMEKRRSKEKEEWLLEKKRKRIKAARPRKV